MKIGAIAKRASIVPQALIRVQAVFFIDAISKPDAQVF